MPKTKTIGIKDPKNDKLKIRISSAAYIYIYIFIYYLLKIIKKFKVLGFDIDNERLSSQIRQRP